MHKARILGLLRAACAAALAFGSLDQAGAQQALHRRDYAQAVSDAAAPASAADYMRRGRARQDNGCLDGALADYTEAARLDAKNVAAYVAQATVSTLRDDFDQAIAAYDRALAADPARASTYALRAHAYDQKGERKRHRSGHQACLASQFP